MSSQTLPTTKSFLLTPEQELIIQSGGNIRINAVAGSGKTTTIIEYARSRPPGSRILYLAFNKSVKLEAITKFKKQGLDHVKIETAHSLAYRHVVIGSRYKIKTTGYQIHEVVDILGLQNNGEPHGEFIFANHINKFVAYFCNSDKDKIKDLDYRETILDSKVKKFVSSAYNYIETHARRFLAMMESGEIEITHDFYLKKFQLKSPILPYDFILFDEAQDASAAMLDVVMKQPAIKVIVGDTHQQIYGWRFAVNSLEQAAYETYHLTSSFRFSQTIADLAMSILRYKNHISPGPCVSIKGCGGNNQNEVKAIIARSNLGLLLKAIEYVTEDKKLKHIYFEGNINSYTYADEGASLYDVLNLYNGKRSMIRDKMISGMNSMNDLETYIEKTEDKQLGMMVEIVKEYGNEIPGILKNIKSKHVENADKHKAQLIFSTVHRCKGMEYDAIDLVNDFITEEKIEKFVKEMASQQLMVPKILEEINLLYVAVTRSKNKIKIHEQMVPKGFPDSAQIEVLKVPEISDNHIMKLMREDFEIALAHQASGKPKGIGFDKIREKHKDAYRPWTIELDEELTVCYCQGWELKKMADHFGRTKGSILSRITKLGLDDLYGDRM